MRCVLDSDTAVGFSDSSKSFNVRALEVTQYHGFSLHQICIPKRFERIGREESSCYDPF
jgi:hypothetical protein